MNLNELNESGDVKQEEDSSRINKTELSNEKKEELARKLTNKILDSNPDIVEKFNNGDIAAINEAIEKLKEKVDFDILEETLNNIVGEEILTR
ncbi:hypothetical protein [uncultured Clostridium sp.]|jgi:Asp-tRNA(Asn)/Glu-tRNA(Gln) amidotransferase B subunit|uniref:hypothetical protein n=1 Tax=uncultured Clostridium sp. TaxID=59620 RepID=UPI0026270F83|nr:hypothetical protein [uncultured Clostridium sp.]